MKTIKYFMLMMFCTSIFWYLVVAFINWDVAWVTGIPEYSFMVRIAMLWGLIVKILIDAIIWTIIEPILKEEGSL